jgi:hypothetical protein
VAALAHAMQPSSSIAGCESERAAGLHLLDPMLAQLRIATSDQDTRSRN